MIEFEVFGVPIPKGSTKAFFRPGMKFPVVTADNDKTKPWAQMVKLVAQQMRPVEIWSGPVALQIRFQMPRPKSLPKTRFSFHLKKPDLDKLLRNIKDSLKGVLYLDDSQVVATYVVKLYAQSPSVMIRAQQVDLASCAWDFQERHLTEV